MTLNETIAELIAGFLGEEWKAYDARALTLAAFFAQEGIHLPAVFASGSYFIANPDDITDDGKVGTYARAGSVWLAAAGDIDAGMVTVIDALNDPTTNDHRIDVDGTGYRITVIEAENREEEFGFPVALLTLDISNL
jgi:hypothetical protein